MAFPGGADHMAFFHGFWAMRVDRNMFDIAAIGSAMVGQCEWL
jgi:hypothetical protein